MTGATVTNTVDQVLLPTIGDLVLVARAGGRRDATARTIRYWRSQELISKPVRAGNHYRYPLAALGEVDGIVRWGFSRANADFIKFARYIEAGTMKPHDARQSCISILDRFRPSAEEARELGERGLEAVRAEAQVAARLRGRRAVLPRRVRVPFDQRAAGLAYLFAEMLDVPDKTEQQAEGLRYLQRIIGLRSGRGGEDRDLREVMPPAEEWRFDLDTLITAAESATDAAALCACRSVEMVCLWFPALLPTLAPYLGAEDVAFFDIAKDFARVIDPAFYAVQFSSRLAHRFNKCSAVELADILNTLPPAAMIAELLRDQPAQTADIVRTGLRPHQRAQLAAAGRALACAAGVSP